MGMGMNQMAGNPFATAQPGAMGGGMGMNPFMTQNAGYVNPKHNQNQYQQSFNDPINPFIGGKGPSQESWAKDVNELGFNVHLDVKKDVKKNDDIKEFQDLFSLGSQSI